MKQEKLLYSEKKIARSISLLAFRKTYCVSRGTDKIELSIKLGLAPMIHISGALGNAGFPALEIRSRSPQGFSH
jgi:hypothetical protein